MDEEQIKLLLLFGGIIVICFGPCIIEPIRWALTRKWNPLRTMSLLYWILFWMILVLSADFLSNLDRINIFGIIFGIVAVVYLWFFMLTECSVCRELPYIQNVHVTDSARILDHLKTTRPVVELRVNRTFTFDGDTHVTCLKTKNFDFDTWSDFTTEPESVNKKIYRVKISVEAGDDTTREALSAATLELKARYSYSDISVRWSGTLPRYKRENTVCGRDACCHWWIGELQFWICSILAMTWPYRWLFQYTTTEVVVVKKKFFVSRNSNFTGTENQDGGRLTSADGELRELCVVEEISSAQTSGEMVSVVHQPL